MVSIVSAETNVVGIIVEEYSTTKLITIHIVSTRELLCIATMFFCFDLVLCVDVCARNRLRLTECHIDTPIRTNLIPFLDIERFGIHGINTPRIPVTSINYYRRSEHISTFNPYVWVCYPMKIIRIANNFVLPFL